MPRFLVWWATTKILIGILREVSLNCTALRAVEWFGWITRDLPEARLLAELLASRPRLESVELLQVLSLCVVLAVGTGWIYLEFLRFVISAISPLKQEAILRTST